MNMPGFTAELSLSELRGHYSMTPKHGDAKSGLVVGQLGSPGFNPGWGASYLELECPDHCFNEATGNVQCYVFRVDPYSFFGSRTNLGPVTFPCGHCSYPCL